jgi:hypothetical protein
MNNGWIMSFTCPAVLAGHHDAQRQFATILAGAKPESFKKAQQ